MGANPSLLFDYYLFLADITAERYNTDTATQ